MNYEFGKRDGGARGKNTGRKMRNNVKFKVLASSLYALMGGRESLEKETSSTNTHTRADLEREEEL